MNDQIFSEDVTLLCAIQKGTNYVVPSFALICQTRLKITAILTHIYTKEKHLLLGQVRNGETHTPLDL